MVNHIHSRLWSTITSHSAKYRQLLIATLRPVQRAERGEQQGSFGPCPWLKRAPNIRLFNLNNMTSKNKGIHFILTLDLAFHTYSCRVVQMISNFKEICVVVRQLHCASRRDQPEIHFYGLKVFLSNFQYYVGGGSHINDWPGLYLTSLGAWRHSQKQCRRGFPRISNRLFGLK